MTRVIREKRREENNNRKALCITKEWAALTCLTNFLATTESSSNQKNGWGLAINFVGLATCASFIEYKNEQKIPISKQMKLLDFKLSLGKVLTLANTTTKRNHSDEGGQERLTVD